MERIAMSQEERDWLDWLKRARDGQVTQKSIAEKMGVSDRWVRRLLAAMKVKGDGVVVHSLRGRPSNRRIDEKIRKRAMEIVKSPDWHDFRPTFASEQLAKRHQIQVSKETVRKWMMAEGVWQSRGCKLREVHAWRPRRSHYGELVQWDTSDHDWLEGRGEPVHHLVRMIDDATSRSWGRFVQRDGTRENMGVLWDCNGIWTGGGLLYRPRFDVHGGPAAGREQGATAQSGSPDPDRPGAARVGGPGGQSNFSSIEENLCSVPTRLLQKPAQFEESVLVGELL